MLYWWMVMFGFGVLAFVDAFFDFGATFRQVVSSGFLLAALGILGRITVKTRQQSKEKLMARIAGLEAQLSGSTVSPEVVEESADVSAHRSVGV